MKLAFRLLRLVVACYLGVCVFLFAFQRSMIYFPPQAESADLPSSSKLEVDGATLRISVREMDGANAVIYFGGNAENVAFTLNELSEAFPDHALYLMHYRGYSGSTGSPNEASIHADAKVLYDDVFAKHSNITLIGRSLGTGVAVPLASKTKIDKLILITPFDSLLNLACQRFSFLPVRWMLIDRFESWRHASKITARTWIIAAAKDEIIPLSSTEKLLGAFQDGIATMQVIDSVGHNSISDSPKYSKALAAIHAANP